MPETRYQLRILDTSGTLLAVLTHWRSLSYERRVNNVGVLQLVMNCDDERVGLFDTDVLIEVWRKVSGEDWYRDFTGLHRTEYNALEVDGKPTFTAYARGPLDLLARRILLGYAGTSYTRKTGAAESVFKSLVEEQAVSGEIARTITGLGVAPNSGGGNNITVQRAWRGLLEVLQEYAGDVGGGDFDLVNTDNGTWEFRWYTGQLGTDRTSGNGVVPPVIFATGFGNMRLPVYGLARAGEINAVTVGGQGTEDERAIVTRTDEAAIAASVWNRCEGFRNASGNMTVDGLNAADAALEEGQAREKFDFAIVQAGPWLYGRDYDLGDLVTCRFGTIERDKKMVAVRINVTPAGERVEVETADVPR